jgi:hypothetical protein
VSNTVDIVIGKLVEIRISAGFRDVGEVDALFAEIGRQVGTKLAPTSKCATVADWRHCTVLHEAAAGRLLSRMTGNNARIVRSAALASRDSASAVMQFMRLIRQSGTAHRQLFFDENALVAWMGEVLTVTERARLRQFLKNAQPLAPAM